MLGIKPDVKLKCCVCGSEYEVTAPSAVGPCRACGDIVDFVYDYGSVSLRKELRPVPSMWRYEALLPLNSKYAVSIGEGFTPLLKAERLGRELGLDALYLKLDSLNPTGSFKDRGASLTVSMFRLLGVKGLLTFSTGNAGVAQAAYCSAAGMNSVVLVPEVASREKIVQMLAYGSKVVMVKGTYDDCRRLAVEACDRLGYVLNGGLLTPTRHEGKKTLAFEVAEGLGWRVPDFYVQAVGLGTGFYAAYKGFMELVYTGEAEAIPKMVLVQAEGAAPVARSYLSGSSVLMPVSSPRTVASAIAVGSTPGYWLLKKALDDSGGTPVIVDDNDILKAVRMLASLEGVLAEPAGAAPIAGIARLREDGFIDRDDLVVAVITGHGLKDAKALLQVSGEPKMVNASLDEVVGAVTE